MTPLMVGSEEAENMPHGRRTLRAEDMPQFDENRGTDMIAGTSKADNVGSHKGSRAQRKSFPF